MSISAPAVEPELVSFSFGNDNPMWTHHVTDKNGMVIDSFKRPATHINQSVTSGWLWDGVADPEFVEHTLSTENDRQLAMLARLVQAEHPEHRNHTIALHEMEQIVYEHTGGGKPAWVESSDPEFQAAMAKHFGCPEGQPLAGLLTNGGRDALHAQHLNPSSQPAVFQYGALSANTGSGFAASDTTLAGEITTASGGLIRGGMTYAHTAGTNTTTLTKTWTANGSDSLPVVVASWANFNATPTGGTMGEESALSSTATITVSGDSLTVTFTLTT